MFGLPFQMHAKVCVGTDMYVHTCTYITYMHTCFRWKDKLAFPMLVKNGKTRERNVLWLHRMEAEGVPDVSAIPKSTLDRGLCPSVDIDTTLSHNFNLEIGLHIYSFLQRVCSPALYS